MPASLPDSLHRDLCFVSNHGRSQRLPRSLVHLHLPLSYPLFNHHPHIVSSCCANLHENSVEQKLTACGQIARQSGHGQDRLCAAN